MIGNFCGLLEGISMVAMASGNKIDNIMCHKTPSWFSNYNR